ncbi:MAG TPA: hypothetical protein ENJ91_10900 [Rhodobacteraceae bacterium]|nr:hypothetical protein [Paracoccaceae bacterium]
MKKIIIFHNGAGCPTQPDPAENAMLGVLVEELIREAEARGMAECIFRQYKIHTQRLPNHHWHLVIGNRDGILVDADIKEE